MKCLFLAINHCHSNHVAHRDLKPENIMYRGDIATEKGVYDQIKIIDFGFSKNKKFSKTRKMSTLVGTPYYVAPEVLEGNYDYECDNWSLGVIMYVMLSGFLPFFGKNEVEVFEKIKSSNLQFE